ncbi:uncharacterized protein RCC_01546 [Ramularia collo-cygni]|uniref:Uncharacterized protein n=1 Tax=Ramularia collo-cygni TaxID=112498 RepID=A0A2D3ULY0_9PEZI|nr:uncharacterized protein RCC_01546 [Ramularia collo-cygni]CZT15712.1 uncharacterized protein RCC_01546 [Ramularia collo-cygni]
MAAKASLQGLPYEMKLAIGNQFEPTSIQVYLDPKRQTAFEINSPEWKGLYSLSVTSYAHHGIIADVIAAARARCDLLKVKLFRSEDITGRIMTSMELGDFKKLEVTVPLYFTLDEQYVEGEDPDEVLISYTMNFTKAEDNNWVCSESDCTERLLLSTIFTDPAYHPDESLAFFRHHPLKSTLRRAALRGLNSPPDPFTRHVLFAMERNIRATFDRYLTSRNLEPPQGNHSRTSEDFTCASPWNADLELVIEYPQAEFYRRTWCWLGSVRRSIDERLGIRG